MTETRDPSFSSRATRGLRALAVRSGSGVVPWGVTRSASLLVQRS